MKQDAITVDVRDDIRNGREPFSRIMKAAAGLGSGGRLLLIAPFEPVPLFSVMRKQGFSHQAEQIAGGEWNVLFTRNAPPPPEIKAKTITQVPRNPKASGPAQIVEVDARGLEPPQPMVRILESLASLPEGAELHARTDRRPMHLYPHLEERGFTAETQEQSDGSFITHIRPR